MLVNDQHYRTIWVKENDNTVIQIIDQCKLPHQFEIIDLRTVNDASRAIKEMWVRGAGLIGATAAFGMYLATIEAPHDSCFEVYIAEAADALIATRPTAVNLSWAVQIQLKVIGEQSTRNGKIAAAFASAQRIADEEYRATRARNLQSMEGVKFVD